MNDNIHPSVQPHAIVLKEYVFMVR